MATLDISQRARAWGVLPSYHGWQGDLVTATPEVEAAILDAMGADSQAPPAPPAPLLTVDRCETGPERAWGWAIQLYALRSRSSWGVGDFADLARFGRWASEAGASVVLLNPLGAQIPSLPYQASPYYTSSRRFRNMVYLRVEDIEGARDADIAPEREAALTLNAHRLIDYDRVFELKTRALEKIYLAAPQPRGFKSYVRRQGSALRDFAARDTRLLSGDASVWFHMWVQFHLDRQLARAGRQIGLITDVPVGFASEGFDAWRWRDYLAPRVSVGAPPDEFFRDGQDWGLPPFNPWKLSDSNWEPFIDAIRAAAHHAAGVRLDHVMSLFRLFWIPEGIPPTKGAYVHYPAPALLSLLAGESRRAKAFVIGEDLGLVEPVVRQQLNEKGSLSYRLIWFEPSPPEQWPHDAVAAIGTHDLPTVAGIWTRTDPETRLHHLRDIAVQISGLPDDASPVDVAVAIYGHLARGATRIVLASLEDALGVQERPNVPGTVHEFPNWRLALPSPLEEITKSEGAWRIVREMEAAGRKARQGPST
jgi:4-alpha-glucanotransferase